MSERTMAAPPGDLVRRIEMLLENFPVGGAGVWARSAAKRLRECAAEITRLRAELDHQRVVVEAARELDRVMALARAQWEGPIGALFATIRALDGGK